MMIRQILVILFLLFGYASLSRSQDTINLMGNHDLYIIIQKNGDTLLMTDIKEVIIYPKHKFTSRRDFRRYERLIRNVKKVYPFAKMAGEKYDIVSDHLLMLKTDKEKKAYIKQLEIEIKDDYEEDLKKLTITQGRILLKLIDREIGETPYNILKDFKGTFSAFFWQTLARIFGHNLKSEYDPQGEDKLLNEIVLQIENGQL